MIRYPSHIGPGNPTANHPAAHWRHQPSSCPLLLLAFLLGLSAISAGAATIIWSGASGTDTNWSNGNNWVGNVAPGGGDDVKFFDLGAVGTASATGTNTPNNLVDASFGGYIGSLQYGNTNGNHTTVITNGATLSVTNTGGLTVGTLTTPSTTQKVYATITGAGGTLVVSNLAANIVIDQGTNTASGGATLRATLDLTGLGQFIATVNRVGVGSAQLGGANNAQSATGTLLLGLTNTISSRFSGNYTAAGAAITNAIDVGVDNGNAGGVNFLFLGQTNAFFVDSIRVGGPKTTSSLLFNPAFSNPTAYFRGTNGPASRVTFWSVGDMADSGSSSSAANGTNDFSGGTVDILVNTMSLGRDRSGNNSGSTTTMGTLTFAAGTINANTLLVGNQAFSTAGNSNPMAGVANVGGPTALLVVNTNLVLGNTTVASSAAGATRGILNVKDGTVWANAISVGAYSAAANTIALTNGTLVLSNTVATQAKALAVFNSTNSTLQLNVSGVTNIVVTNLVAGGLTNLIKTPSVAVFGSYPTQVPLIKVLRQSHRRRRL